MLACAAVASVSLVAACGTDAAPSGQDSAPAGSVSASALPAITPITCDPSTVAPGETVTRSAGGHDSAISVVADYHWAIITARDSARAIDAIAPNEDMGKPQFIEQALAGYPPGTTYCLRLRQTAPDTVLFTLTYQSPAGATGEYKLRATVSGPPGDVQLRGEVAQ
ncbi:hypothetical protein GCM10009722_19810 [Williamsia deligens]|nr:hypothetical protein [Williamsia deligens]